MRTPKTSSEVKNKGLNPKPLILGNGPLHQREVVACQNVEFFLEKTSKNFKNDQKNRGNPKHAVQPLQKFSGGCWGF
jgi:hypothetical protein